MNKIFIKTTMQHPNSECQKKQEEILRNCPEELREEYARSFRCSNAAYIYHQLANESQASEKMPALYDEWLNSLPSKIAGIMKSRGFEQCKTVLSFTHFVNEHNNKNMNEWMKEHLSEEDFAYYINADRE